MKNKVWSITWPLVLILLGFWFAPLLTVIYLLIGMAVKIGQLSSSGYDREPDFKSAFGYIVEAYYILTWPRFFAGDGYKGLIKILGSSLLVVGVLFGGLYYLGTSAGIPDSVTEDYKAVLSEAGHPLSEPVKEEISKRIKEGFTYTDMLWSRNQILDACGYEKQSESPVDQFKTTLIVGLFSLDSSYSSGTIAAQHARYNLSCSVKEKAE
ncbi:hypothetical protein L3Q72_00295 [Vibrio sp. JC009]|uniref:hypothetical protein n=1 Tax=Vibrio sp. JC009 TaxID=2912314 RepID=UPI0023B08836|nr:hypothetical protein [Vibrio sp. JC009]WED21892.1 hypothetical protein L3Q72_00295 [Vibrio sp. JC009]